VPDPTCPKADFWLNRLFRVAEQTPGVLRVNRKAIAWLAFRFSRDIREGTLANAGRILGPDASRAEQERFARKVVEYFILFCYDIGQSLQRSESELFDQIEQIEGHDHYVAARQMRRGAIVVTAHLGSFEVGMAALRRQDAKIHVVFRRDVFPEFESMRSRLRNKLGVIEVPVDDGWTMWMRLRDALQNDEVVVLQGDRVMPGQKGQRVNVLGHDMLLPTGPAKLAAATGSPIIPVFSIRMPSGKIRLCVEPAITVSGNEVSAVENAMQQLGRIIGKYIQQYGEQWLMLQPAWCEDSGRKTSE
jgi:lauroyl/myristoyl acyltransferase